MRLVNHNERRLYTGQRFDFFYSAYLTKRVFGQGGQPLAGVDFAEQRAYFFPVKIDLAIIPWTPFLPSTSCVMAKSAAMLESM